MVRLALTLILVLVAALLFAWWADHPGAAVITWQAWRIDTTFAVLVFLVFIGLAFALWLQGLIFRAKHGLPFLGLSGQLRRQKRGLEHLNRAVVALAAGDAKAAQRLVKKAAELLAPQPMLRVLAAQAAKLGGDPERARAEFEALAQDAAAGFLGVRGLLMEAVGEGRDREALRFAERAREIEPKSVWAIRTHFNLQVKAADWEGARATLNAAQKARAFDRAATDALAATLLYCQAKEADLANGKKAALRLAEKALKAKAGFLPAALLVSRLNREKGKESAAARILEKAWKVEPHPELALAYANLAPMETATARLKRFKKLTGKATDAESLLQLAERALEAEHLGEAEALIQRALKKTNRARGFALLRAIEEKRGAPVPVLEELAEKTEGASPEPMWVCASCAAKAPRWSLHCPSCRMFNALAWEGARSSPASPSAADEDFVTVLPAASGTPERLP
ncbi:MAG TPA: heme biosynthesis HemY N-terminal domain-containing protein [Sphingomonadales bacterium]|nr:heme biosynthesis HemY N-terminal domain-containing protein [Sphingomonadales bacterium]